MDLLLHQTYSFSRLADCFGLGSSAGVEPPFVQVMGSGGVAFLPLTAIGGESANSFSSLITQNDQDQEDWKGRDCETFIEVEEGTANWMYLGTAKANSVAKSKDGFYTNFTVPELLPKALFQKANGGQDWISKGGGLELAGLPGDRTHDRIAEGLKAIDGASYYLSRWEGDSLTFEYDDSRGAVRHTIYNESGFHTSYAFAPEEHNPPTNEEEVLWMG